MIYPRYFGSRWPVTDVDRWKDRYSQLQDQEAECRREVNSATRLQVRVQEEKKTLSRDYAALEEKAKKVSDERRELQEKLSSMTTDNSRLKDTLTEGGKTSTSLHDKLAAVERELSKVKKAYEKDTKIYLGKEEERKATKEKVQTLELEKKHLEDKCKSGEEERQHWREQRDQMVGQLETLMTKLVEENKALRAQLQDDKDHDGKLLDEERQEKQEMKRQLKVVQRAKDSLLTDLRHGNYQLQTELAHAKGQEPPPPLPPPQQYSFRVNDSDLVDDIDTTGHLEVDATPPVAAKSLRKGRKRTSTLIRSSDSAAGSKKSRRKPRGKQQDTVMEVVKETPEFSEKSNIPTRLQELEEKTPNSPITRSAKKLLQFISPERNSRNTANQENTPVAEETPGKCGQRKIKEEPPLDTPFECAPYQMMEMLTRMDIKMDITQEEMKETKASIDSLNESFSGLKEEDQAVMMMVLLVTLVILGVRRM
ncbi:hypothetical protein ACOMHN_044783 [Nucella lapillus]